MLRSGIEVACTMAALTCLLLMLGCGPDDEFVWTTGNARIRGLVKDHLGNPLGQASVVLEGARTYSTYTDRDGKYEIDDIAPGMYDLVAHREIGGTDYRFRVRFLELRNDMTLDMIDIGLQAAASIEGKATLRGSGRYNPSFPDDGGIKVEIVGTGIDTVTASDGSYTLSPVEVAVMAPGIGSGLAIPSSARYELYFSKDGFTPGTIRGLAVAPATVTSAPDVELLPSAPSPYGALAGRVLLEAALNDDYGDTTVSIDGTTRSVVTTSGGYYRFDNLPAGVYKLRFSHEDYFETIESEVKVVPGIPVNPVDDVKLSNHRRISETIQAYDLALSPSGNQLAYITSEATSGGEIGLVHPGGVAFNQVITSGAHAVAHRGLSWTPDEREILYVRFVGGAVNAYTIGVTDDTGSKLRTLVATGTDYFGVAWSPDRKSLAYYLSTNLYAVDVDRSSGETVVVTDTTRQIVPIGNVTSWSGMEWANTGRIVYSPVIAGSPSEIFIVLAGGGTSMALDPTLPDGTTTVFPPLLSPAFSPDWSRVAFSVESPSTSPHGIYVCDVDGSNARRISESPGRHITWNGSGERIYYIDEDDRICELIVPGSL